MKTKRFHLLLIVYFFISACGISPQRPVYKNDAFHVDLPVGWTWGGDYWGAGSRLFTIRNSDGLLPSAIISVATLEQSERQNALLMIEQTYSDSGVLTNGITREYESGPLLGEEIYFSFARGDAVWMVREIWLENNGVVYILCFRAIESNFDKYMGAYELVLESFTFK